VAELAHHPNIIAIKDSSGSLQRIQGIVEATRGVAKRSVTVTSVFEAVTASMMNSVSVQAATFVSAGDLAVGGGFTAAGDQVSAYFARWGCPACHADFNHDGDTATDLDIEDFFRCIAGNCCATCDSADFNYDGDTATDADIEAFFRVLAGGHC